MWSEERLLTPTSTKNGPYTNVCSHFPAAIRSIKGPKYRHPIHSVKAKMIKNLPMTFVFAALCALLYLQPVHSHPAGITIKRDSGFGEPSDDVFVIDVKTISCSKLSDNTYGCPLPDASSGYGSANGTKWVGVKKDFALKANRTDRQFLTYKTVDLHSVSLKNTLVIVDISVGDKPGSEWVEKSNGIWVLYGSTDKGISALNVLFGTDAVDPRPNWKLLSGSLNDTISPEGQEAHIEYRKGPKLDYRDTRPKLNFNSDKKFKILQIADLHYSTGVGKCRDPVPADIKDCEADPRTLQFIEKVLDIEKPDYIALTGDQNYGPTSPDPETAIFKALAPFIKRKLPFSVVLGNHDDETYLSRNETLAISVNMPYSLTEHGPDDIFGSGNYFLNLPAPDGGRGLSMYFLDSGAYNSGGYDWIKKNQLDWVKQTYQNAKKSITGFENNLAMAFFHIPLQEYKQKDGRVDGTQLEDVAAGKVNTGAKDTLAEVGVQVATVGHDHLNDYCVHDNSTATGRNSSLYLCYGGGLGEGGYGGKGFVRRLRIWEADASAGQIQVWKRSHDTPDKTFDQMVMVSDGKVV